MIEIIAAMDENRGIGKDNTLVWSLPSDMKHFVSLTKNKCIIMGRKTYESIGKALPHRMNVVITSQDIDAPNVYTLNSREAALAFCNDVQKVFKQNVMVIGGAQIYEMFLPFATVLHLTQVYATFDCDTFFPEYANDFKYVEHAVYDADEKHAHRFRFETLIRKDMSIENYEQYKLQLNSNLTV